MTEKKSILDCDYKSISRFDPDDDRGLYNEKAANRCNRRDALYQGFASFMAHSLALHAGINFAFSTVLHPQLNITKDQASWIASLTAIGTSVGSIIIGLIMDRIGRQRSFLVACIPIIVSWSLLFFQPPDFDIRLIYLARFLSGLGGGLGTISIVYVAEVSNKHWRPMFLSINSIAVSGGILITTTIGVLLAWRAFSLFCLILISISTVIFLTLPESPAWLFQYSPTRARKELGRLVSCPKVFDDTWRTLEGNTLEKGTSASKGEEFSICEKKVIRPLLVIFSIIILQQLVGIYPTIFYSLELFSEIKTSVESSLYPATQKLGHPINITADNLNWTTSVTQLMDVSPTKVYTLEYSFLYGNENIAHPTVNSYSMKDNLQSTLNWKNPEVLALICLGTIRFIASITTVVLSRFYGRRPLLIFSSIGVAVSAAVFSIYDSNWFLASNSTVSYLIILVFITCGSLGLLVIPWTLVGELLPLQLRGIGQGALVSFAYVLMFFTVKLYPYMVEAFGLPIVFLSFSIGATISAIFSYFFVPETLGKTFSEIQEFFENGKNSK